MTHALKMASRKRRSSSSARSSIIISSIGGEGRAAASTSSLLCSKLAPLEAGYGALAGTSITFLQDQRNRSLR